MKKMWEGRFQGPADARFERWQRSLPFDWVLFPYEVAANRVYAQALEKIGVLSAAETKALLGALDEIAKQAEADPAAIQDDEAEDIHHRIEKWLIELVGEPGYKIHTGRSRNEQVATSLRLYTRESIDAIRGELRGLLEALIELAERHRGAALPAYTHMQRAEPVLVAHWLLAYAEMFFRDAERLGECRRRVNVSPLGSGAVAGATLKLDRAWTARELGFEGVTANSMDATSDREFVAEFLQVLTLASVHLSRLAEELALFATREYGFIELPEAFSTGSSAMPQKKNPDALELLRGKAGRVAGAAVAVVVAQKGLPLAYNKDMQETQEPLFVAARTVEDAVAIAAGFVRAVKLNTETMDAAAQSGSLNATAAANYLVRRGVAFRKAHAIVGQAVRRTLEKGCELEALPLKELREFSDAFGEDFAEALQLERVLAEHDVTGGTAPARVEAALQAARARLAADFKDNR